MIVYLLNKGELGYHLYQYHINSKPSTNRWLAQRNNVNNAWIFNGNNGRIDDNNVTNSNAVRGCTHLLAILNI